MDKIVFANGQEVELSAETVRNFRKQLGLSLFDQVNVDRFRAMRRTDSPKSDIRFALVDACYTKWDGKIAHKGVRDVHLLTHDEVLDIISGLQRLTEDG